MSKEEELKSGSVQAFMAGFAAHNHEENVLSGDDMYFQSQCRIIRGEEAKITVPNMIFSTSFSRVLSLSMGAIIKEFLRIFMKEKMRLSVFS